MSIVHGHVLPWIYAAPSAVSHQSRIDIRHSPGFVQAPLIYSPAASLFASHQSQIASDTVLTPIFASDAVLTPIGLSFYHNLPLTRALEHPVSIDKIREECAQNDSAASVSNKEAVIIKEIEKENLVVPVQTKLEPTNKLETLIVNDENNNAVKKEKS